MEIKWRRQNRKCLLLKLDAWKKARHPRNINGNTHIFYIWQSNGAIESALRLNRECEIQDGDHKTGSDDISACRQDSA